MQYKISIIIPVFNVEDYIEDALTSILRQTIGFEQLEVIMVDDCSTDKSGEIIDDYANKYKNVIAMHLPKNSGFGGKPRNIGMERASGEYLMFLDAHDYYTDDACELLYKKIIDEDADIITGKFAIQFEDGKIINPSSWGYQLYSCNVPEIKNMKSGGNKKLLYDAPPTVMTKIFKRNFIKKNNIIFPEGVPGEDLAFAVHCFIKADDIVYINKDVLIIRKRETKNRSVSYSVDKKYINGLIEAYAYIDRICKKNGTEDEFPLIMARRFPYWFNQFILSDLTISEKKKSLKSIRPLLNEYQKSGLTLPDKYMPILECIVNKKYDDAILLFDQLKTPQKSQINDNKSPNQKGSNIPVSIIMVVNGQESLSSILNMVNNDKIELVILDNDKEDNSTINVEELSKEYQNINLIKLKDNKVNLANIRNIGIKESNGKYILFIDSKDEINVDNLLEIVEYANKQDLDAVKCPIKVVKDNKVDFHDLMSGDNKNQLEIVRMVMARQNTTLDLILKRKFLIKNNVSFNEKCNFGIKTLFYADFFEHKPKIEYYNSYIYVRNDDKNISSIQKYQDRELNDCIEVMELIKRKLNKIDINYYEIKFLTIIKSIINSIIFYSNGEISKKSFKKLSSFLNANIKYVKTELVLSERYEQIYDSIIEKNYKKFHNLSKKRLLVAGMDLKFIRPALKYFKDDFNIKVDEWTGEDSHDEQKSIRLLNWADFIFCEWFLGNAAWYSKRKMDHQKLIIRAHKFELSRDFGNQINFENVDGVIAISYYFLELFSNIFKIPRRKMIMLSNYVETDIYTGIKTDADFKHNIAIVGYIPRWKGLLRGIKILKMLRDEDEQFKLYLIGQHYKEVQWVWNNSIERSYFNECENFIKENDLEDSVIFQGWVERSKMFNNIGYVLSVTDIEGSHLAPAEGLAASTLAFLLNWEGAEYVYPKELIFDSINDIKDMILTTYRDESEYNMWLEKMNRYVINEFNIEKFVVALKSILQKIK